MKTIQEWRADLLAEELGIDPMIARKFMGSNATIKVDPSLKSSLRSKLNQLRQSPEFSGTSDEEFFRAIVAAAWSIIGDFKGSSFDISKGVRSFGGEDGRIPEDI